MSEPLIQLRGLAKHYPSARTGRERLGGLWSSLAGRAPRVAATVLEDVDLTVARGQALAVLGENGAGKSTLLKIIAGVLRPSAGTVEVRGRLGALLDLGAGFHPEFSGRQNVRTAATLAGLPAAEIDAWLADIVEFAQLGVAIDQPVKHYSSGMTVRLGFAVIAALRPDILISDEVLAVGDESFQKKCIRWLEDYLTAGGTLVLVSHSIYHVQKLCRRAVWLERGRIHLEGDVFEVSQAYLAHHEAKLRGAGPGATAAQRVQLEALRVNDTGPRQALAIEPGARIAIEARWRGCRPGDRICCLIRQTDGALIARTTQPAAGPDLDLTLADLPLLPGHYQLELLPLDRAGTRCGDPARRLLRVTGSSREFGSLALPRRWA